MENLSTTISMKIFSDDMHYGNIRDIWVYMSKTKLKEAKQGRRKKAKIKSEEYIVQLRIQFPRDIGTILEGRLLSLLGFIASLGKIHRKSSAPFHKGG